MHRYSASMGPELLPHWRKSCQWFSLTREHATHVLADASVLATFAAFCQNAWDADSQRCVRQERLMRSLLNARVSEGQWPWHRECHCMPWRSCCSVPNKQSVGVLCQHTAASYSWMT